jgi:transposase-like protein
MSDFTMGVLTHLTAILLGAAIAALVTWAFAKLATKRRLRIQQDAATEQMQAAIKEATRRAREDLKKEYQQKYEAALPALARSLAKLIMEPLVFDKVENNARAIVSTRNEMRKTITNLNELLNSEIDRLETLVRSSDKDKADRRGEMIKTIETLQLTWKDGKVDRIQILLRRLLAENGLAEIFDDQFATTSRT